MIRETIYQAVFNKFAALSWTPIVPNTPSAFATASRLLKHWSDLPTEMWPALYQVQIRETPIQKRGFPTKWQLSLALYIYVRTNAQLQGADGDPDVATASFPSRLLNPILDALTTALLPDNQPEGTCTLGGLVSHCWLSDSIETSEGLLGDIEFAIVPIEIVVSP